MKKILVIEDEQDARMVLVRRLQSHRFEVLQAADGEAGLAEARRAAPDLIVLDVMLPAQDGMQVYQALREDPATREVPVLFLTAVSSGLPMSDQSMELLARAKHGAKMTGRFAVMTKPYGAPELITRIRELLEPEQGQPAQAQPGKRQQEGRG